MSAQPSSSAVNNAATLKRLRENGIHSVFDVVREGRGAFVARLAGSSSEVEARQLYDLAMQRASGIARLHTSLLARDEPTNRALPKLASGGSRERMESLSLSESGDYESWFGQAGLYPAPDSVASLFSPASYLVDLYRVAKKLHAADSAYHIDMRRPDLAGLILSQGVMDTELPTLDLVNEILAGGIEGSTDAPDVADELIRTAVYPFGLPYDVHADEITLGLHALGTDERHVHELLTTLDVGPLRPPTDNLPGDQVRARLGLSPGEYALLIDPSGDGSTVHWGGAHPTTARELVEKSGLTLHEIHEVLGSDRAIRDGGTTSSNPLVYGASYINQGLTGTAPNTLNLVVSKTDADICGSLENTTRWQTFEYLQRLIRLKAHVLLSFEEIDWIWAQTGGSGPSLHLTLELVARYLPLRARFNLSVDAFAAIFGRVNAHARAGKISLLAQLFQPGFAAFFAKQADFGSAASMDNNTAPGRLAQGLGIDQQTLRRLALLLAKKVDGASVNIMVTEDFVAGLYRLVEIPRLVGLSVEEGFALWTCLGYHTDALAEQLASAPSAFLINLVRFLLERTIRAADWLHDHAIDIPTLLALVATKHRILATEEIAQFVRSIQTTGSNDMAQFSADRMEDTVIEDHLARHVGSQFNLTAGTARAVIRWIDKVIAVMEADLAGYSSKKFWEEVATLSRNAAPSDNEGVPSTIVQYCHLLGQFALACHLTGLQEQDIALIVAPVNGVSRLYDHRGDDTHAVPPLTLDTVFWLYSYTEWREALPGSAAEARPHFGNSSASGALYKIADFAELNGWDPGLGTQVWALLGHATLADMSLVHQWASWMKVAMDLQLSPDNLSDMFDLLDATDISVSGELRKTLAPAILSTVRATAGDVKTSAFAAQLTENRRDALLRYYLHNVVPPALKPKIKTPDDLYEYMLIDPQVSAKVTTSRIAEAIASVQLYMHRCREGLELDVLSTALATEMKPGGYFAFWDAYNKRYGTWAGLQRLLRYPASYIDPSLRYIKTTIFRDLEDGLSQGRLTGKRAEDAFLAYTEAVCETLEIEYIDGYFDDSNKVPNVFFLGKNNESPARYFWRRGRLLLEAAGDWTEWQPVEADIPTYTTTGERPSIVYYSGALRVVWWTWETTSTTATVAGDGQATLNPTLQLQIHIATLGTERVWRTFGAHPIYYSGSYLPLSQTHVAVYDDVSGSERLLFLAADNASWNPTVAYRSFDTYLNSGDGPIAKFKIPVSTEDRLYVRRKLSDDGTYLYVQEPWMSMVRRASYPLGYKHFDIGNNVAIALSSRAAPFFREQSGDGIDTLLSYLAQTTPVEPHPDGVTTEPVRWHSSTGIYLWELFLHAPFLVACRLIDEQRFDEAETWLRRIFSPSGYVDAEGNQDEGGGGKVRYWNVRPLQEDTTWGPISSAGTDDPDAVAMADPMHYKLAVYQRWMQLYMDRGDMAYRQQTRDTMTEAKMWYVQATQLLGRRPYFHDVLPGYWNDPSLATAAAMTAPALDALEAIVGDDLPLPPTHSGQVRIVDGVFLPPVDDGSLVWWERFAQRLYNLRHGLSLDGHPMSLPLYETPVSPRELQLRRLAADGGASGLEPGMIAMPSQRFTSLLDRARGAVQQLMQFGATLQGILERRDADALSVLQQTQQVNIQAMAKEVHTFQIKMLEHNAAGLNVTKAQARDRQGHYTRLVSQYMNTAEIASMAARTTAPGLLQLSVGATISAAALDMVPNTWIAGMAAGIGGTTWSAVARAVAEGITTEANALEMIAGNLDMMASFDRRGEEWQLQADQAAREVEQLDTQVNASKAAIEQAMKQATQIETEQGYAQAVLDVLTTRFTGKDLFSWQSGRMSTLYYQLYDATLSLCAWAQKAYHFETQDSTPFLQPGAWDDRYQGLLAGESLALGLQRLERAYLAWDQRVLEVERTLSLNALAAKSLGGLIADAFDTVGTEIVSDKLKVKYDTDVLTLSFTLSSAGIRNDYPDSMHLGNLRRIKSIAVTLPAVLGAYEDVRAVLAYAEGAVATLPSGCTAVTLSRGIADHGIFMFDFNNGKYFPFEGIPVGDNGTLSLRFPNAVERPQEDMLRSLNDVILHIRYTILSE